MRSPVDRPAPALTPAPLKFLLIVIWGRGCGVTTVDGMSPPARKEDEERFCFKQTADISSTHSVQKQTIMLVHNNGFHSTSKCRNIPVAKHWFISTVLAEDPITKNNWYKKINKVFHFNPHQQSYNHEIFLQHSGQWCTAVKKFIYLFMLEV